MKGGSLDSLFMDERRIYLFSLHGWKEDVLILITIVYARQLAKLPPIIEFLIFMWTSFLKYSGESKHKRIYLLPTNRHRHIDMC
jgi:hypothetical protein